MQAPLWIMTLVIKTKMDHRNLDNDGGLFVERCNTAHSIYIRLYRLRDVTRAGQKPVRLSAHDQLLAVAGSI